MKLTIRRSLSSRILMTSVPVTASPDLTTLISSHHQNVTPDLPDMAFAKGLWPNVTLINFSGAEPLAPGIKIVKGSDLSLDTFGITTVIHGIGESVSNGAGGTIDVSNVILAPYPDLNSGISGNGINLIDTLRFKSGLATDSDFAIADTYINQTPNGNLPAVISLASRGSSKIFPYFQSTNIFPNKGKTIDSVTLLDSICMPTVPIPAASIATLSNLLATTTYASGDCFYTELDVNDNLLSVGQNADTDYYLIVPISVNGGSSTVGQSGIAGVTGVGSWSTGLPSPYQGALAVFIIPFAYLRANITYNSDSDLPINGIAQQIVAQAIDGGGTRLVAEAGFAARLSVSLGPLSPNLMLDPTAGSVPAVNFA